jgi:guanylate kinase
MKKNILIIAGPSAVGKTTVAHRMLELEPRFEFVRSVTTRPCRADQFDNEYIYITKEEFLDLIENSGVLEHTEYAGNLYGTPRSEIDRITSEGKIPLLILDINGVESLSKNKGDIFPCGVYVYDDLKTMNERLHERFKDCLDDPKNVARMQTRIKQNILDYMEMPKHEPVFYSFVQNRGSVDECAEKVLSVFRDFCNEVEKNKDETKVISVALTVLARAEIDN